MRLRPTEEAFSIWRQRVRLLCVHLNHPIPNVLDFRDFENSIPVPPFVALGIVVGEILPVHS